MALPPPLPALFAVADATAAAAADGAIWADIVIFDLDGYRCKLRNCFVCARGAFETRGGKGQLDIVWLAFVQDFFHNRHSAASINSGVSNTVGATATTSAKIIIIKQSRL